MDESASPPKTASPIALPMVWWGAAAVARGWPINQVRQDCLGLCLAVRRMMFSLSGCSGSANEPVITCIVFHTAPGRLPPAGRLIAAADYTTFDELLGTA